MGGSEWYQKLITIPLDAIILIFTISLLVAIHELGHFLAARISKVGVLEFSLGMGKLLYEKLWKGTSYQIRAIPIGGFVRLKGEEQVGSPFQGEPDDFYMASPWKRLFIVFAGPFMNLGLALFIFSLVHFFQGELHTVPVVGYVKPHSHAEELGFSQGDRVQSVDLQKVGSFEDFLLLLKERESKHVKVSLLSASGKEKELTFTPKTKARSNIFGEIYKEVDLDISPPLAPVIGGVGDMGPAKKAGLKAGDKIIRVFENEISHWAELTKIVRESPEKTLDVLIEREGQQMTLKITPKLHELQDPNDPEKKQNIGLLGVSAYTDNTNYFTRDLSFKSSLLKGGEDCWLFTKRTFFAFKKLIFDQFNRDSVGGPIQIANYFIKAARSGFFDWFLLLGIISINLALFNFIPFPALDGGHAFFFISEILLRRPLSHKIQEGLNKAGFCFLLGLLALVSINDIIRVLGY